MEHQLDQSLSSDSTENIRAKQEHTPVLLDEILVTANVKPGDRWVDATFGRGGHTTALLKLGASVLGLDQDGAAREAADRLKQEWKDHFDWRNENFRELTRCCHENGWRSVAGVLMDLGVSSPQIDTPERGFSFRTEGPLDMRMDQRQPQTAAEVINTWSETDLAQLFYEYGGEKQSRRVARAVVARRQSVPFAQTRDLADFVAQTIPFRRGDSTHPATKVFQALRLVVNREQEALVAGLPQALSLLHPGGVLAVISFHSGEDRMVKEFMRSHASPWLDTPGYPNTLPNPVWLLERPHRFLPTPTEILRNPRSRSARLRVARRNNQPWPTSGVSGVTSSASPPSSRKTL